MKTITKNGEYIRVSEKEADSKVSKFGWSFAPKSEWKKIRDANKKSKKEKEEEAN